MTNQKIDYKIVRMKRKSLALHILKDGSVEVRAPHRMPEKTLTDFVEQKKDWIMKAKERQASAIVLPTYTPKEISEMKDITKSRIHLFLMSFDGVKPAKINIRKQKSVWGTCNKKGTVTINVFCSLLPDALFEYIMIHELCHLIELNHSPKFWAVVSSYLPDWKEKRACLKKFHLR